MGIQLGSAFGKISIDATDVKKGVKVAVDALKTVEPALKHVDGSLAQAQSVIKQTANELSQLKASFTAATPKATIEAYNQARQALDAARVAAKGVGAELRADVVDADKLKAAYTKLKQAVDALPKRHGPAAPPGTAPEVLAAPAALDTRGLASAATQVRTAVAGLAQALRTALSGNVAGGFAEARAAVAGLGAAAQGASAGVSTLTVALGAAAVAVGVLVAALAVAKVGLDALVNWSNQLDELQDILGVTTDEATRMALSMKHVGLSVDEGTAAFAYFARGVAEADRRVREAAAAMTQADRDAAEQQQTVWADLAKARAKIQANLATDIAAIERGLGRQMADMAHDHTRQLEGLARDAVRINADAAQSLAKLERERARDLNKVNVDQAKSLARVDADLKTALRNAHSARARRELRRQAAERKREIAEEAAERRAEIEARAAERRAEIEEGRRERQAELAEKRALLVEEFEYRKQRAREAADEQIAQARRAAAEQLRAAQEAAQAQADAIAKALDKQFEAIRRQTASDPFLEALATLKVSLYDAEGNVKSVTQLMDEMRDMLSQMPDGPEKTNAVLALMGRGGAKFLDWMSLSRAEVDKIYEANKDSYKLTEQQQERIQAMQRAWNDIRTDVEGLAVALGVAVLPIVEDLTDMVVRELMPAVRALARWIQSVDWSGLKVVVDVFRAGGPQQYMTQHGIEFGQQLRKQWLGIGEDSGEAYTEHFEETLEDEVPGTSRVVAGTTTDATNRAKPRSQAAAESLGRVFDTGLANGITRNAVLPERAVSGVVASAVRDVNALSASLSLGQAIASGVALGIFNNRKAIADSLRFAVMLALLDVRNSIGAHSPSTLFAEQLGVPIGLGILKGFEESVGGLQRSLAVNVRGLAAAPAPAPIAGGPAISVVIAPHFHAPLAPNQEPRLMQQLRELVHAELAQVIR